MSPHKHFAPLDIHGRVTRIHPQKIAEGAYVLL
jgi:hypothetical protein